MAVSISGTTLTFNDATTQTTARTASNTVTSIVAGTGITVSGATGAVTVNASGSGTVTSVSGTNGLTGTVTTSGSLSIDTSFNSIGTIAGLCNWSSQILANGTLAGSSLGYFSGTNGGDQGAPFTNGTRRNGNVSAPGTGTAGYINTTAASGTWRALSGVRARNYLGCPDETIAYWSVWIRIS